MPPLFADATLMLLPTPPCHTLYAMLMRVMICLFTRYGAMPHYAARHITPMPSLSTVVTQHTMFAIVAVIIYADAADASFHEFTHQMNTDE